MPAPRSTHARWVILLLAVGGGLGAQATGPQPTALAWADVVAALMAGGTVVVVAARAERAAWRGAALLTLVGSIGSWPATAAAAALLSVAALADARRRGGTLVGASVGAGIVQVLLRLPEGRTGLNAIVGLGAVGILATSAWRRAPERDRRVLGQVLRVGGAVAGAAALGLVVAVLLARAELSSGIDRAEEGLDAAQDGHGAEAAVLLDAAAADLSVAHDRIDGWWTAPARALPWVGPQVDALAGLSSEGARLSAAGADAVREAGIDDLRVVDGRVDLEQVRSMAEPLRTVRTDLARALAGIDRARSPWLVAPLAGGLARFERSVQSADRDAETAEQAVAVLPALLGDHRDRSYLVAFGTPAETRELGGFMGAYALLSASDGDLSLASSGRVRNLNVFLRGGQLADPSAFPPSYLAMLPQRFWHNTTATPDFPTMTEAVGQLFRPPRAGRLDGVLYLDPHTLASLLELTGPIRVEGHDQPLTSRNAARFLLREQYTKFPGDDRHEFLVDAAEQVFEELTTGTLPEPREVADAITASVEGRRLLAHSFHPQEQALFERLGVDGSLPAIQGDFLTVRSQNRGLNKIDALLQRTVQYDVAVDPATGTVIAEVRVTLRNDAPASGLPFSVIGNRLGQPAGTNSTTLSIYSPLDLVDVTEDGAPIGRAASEEYGRNRFAVLLDIPARSERTVVFELSGALDLSGGYHLDVIPQPLANPDRLTVSVRVPGASRWFAERHLERRRHTADVSVDFPR